MPKTVHIVAQLPVHIPGFNPPIPNMQDPEILRRLDAIAILSAARTCLEHKDPEMTLERINAAIDTLKA
jgi:hypothetical protein